MARHLYLTKTLCQLADKVRRAFTANQPHFLWFPHLWRYLPDNRQNDHYPRTPPSPPALHDGASVSSALFRLPDLSAYSAFCFRRSGQTTSATPLGNTTGPPVAAESTAVNIGTLSQHIPVGVALYIADNIRLVVASTTAAAAIATPAVAIAVAVATVSSVYATSADAAASVLYIAANTVTVVTTVVTAAAIMISIAVSITAAVAAINYQQLHCRICCCRRFF
ncbi:transmembrane protein, putative, partial [Rhizoctonia solani AG-3 Rhs1AP]